MKHILTFVIAFFTLSLVLAQSDLVTKPDVNSNEILAPENKTISPEKIFSDYTIYTYYCYFGYKGVDDEEYTTIDKTYARNTTFYINNNVITHNIPNENITTNYSILNCSINEEYIYARVQSKSSGIIYDLYIYPGSQVFFTWYADGVKYLSKFWIKLD